MKMSTVQLQTFLGELRVLMRCVPRRPITVLYPPPPPTHHRPIPTPKMASPTDPEAPLRIYTTVASLRSFRQGLYGSHRTLGFVPTMGALHEGHLALVRQAAAENDAVAVSIFVNPAQFSPSEDLARYPRTLAADIAALEDVNRSLGGEEHGRRGGRIEALFLPSVAEMYPPNGAIPLDVSRQRGAFVSVHGPQGSRLEGASRPQFFRGVATVVAKLFNAVQADRAYFGQDRKSTRLNSSHRIASRMPSSA